MKPENGGAKAPEMKRFSMLLAERDSIGALAKGRAELMQKVRGIDNIMQGYCREARERLGLDDSPGDFAWVEPEKPDGEWQWGFLPEPEKAPGEDILGQQKAKADEFVNAAKKDALTVLAREAPTNGGAP